MTINKTIGDKSKKPKNLLTTSKKQHFVGIKKVIDAETGELIPVQITRTEDRDFNFHKVWLEHFINSLDDISNKKLKLAFWIIDNLDYENKLIMTLRTIAEKSGISYKTVANTMKALQTGTPPFLQKINSGAYRVNPNILWQGKHTSRMGVIFEYTSSASNKTTEKDSESDLQLNLHQDIPNDLDKEKYAQTASQEATKPKPRTRKRQTRKQRKVQNTRQQQKGA